MGYTADGDLADLFDSGPLRRSVRRLAEAVGDDLAEEVRRRTPVSEPPPGWGEAEWAAHRGRPPGRMRESWHATKPEDYVRGGGTEGAAVEVYSDDPAAVFVENDTAPHRIEGEVSWPGKGGDLEVASGVDHPGTQGHHMMRDSLEEVHATWAERHGQPELERWAREQVGQVGRVRRR